MQKSDKPSYASHRIIGKLFREIKAVMTEEIREDSYECIPLNKEFLIQGYEVTAWLLLNLTNSHFYSILGAYRDG